MVETAILLFAAVVTGVITADAFTRAWTGLLRSVASLTLFLRKEIPGEACFMRLSSSVPVAILCTLVLILSFSVYFRTFGLGQSEMEQLAYFVGAVSRTGFYLIGAPKLIDAMFKPGDDG